MSAIQSRKDNRVLILGVYLLDAPNHAASLSENLTRSEDWGVDLCWAALGSGNVPEEMELVTALKVKSGIPKFRLLNDLLESVDLGLYRYIVVTDDDIELSDGFLDRYLRLQDKYEFSLAQPARTHDSYVDHWFVAQLLGVEARLTRFVEIGPLFSVQRDAFSRLLPFDEGAPMGWGLDFVWPIVLKKEGRRLGIVDATPVEHALRKPVAFYDYDETNNKMRQFLAGREHLVPHDAFVALETYPLETESDEWRENLIGGPKRDEYK